MLQKSGLGGLGDHVGPKAGPRSKTRSILTLPIRTLLGAFSAPFSLWDALGTLKWRFLGGFRFDTTFFIKI